MTKSAADCFLDLPIAERERRLASLKPAEIRALKYDWNFWGRPEQFLPSGDWATWLILAGRGWGKTRTGVEAVRAWVKSGRYRFINLIGATADDARDIMIDGESGILATLPKSERPTYHKYQRRLAWPNGASSLIFTADEPERLRGKQHMKLWADELAAWRYPAAWDMALFGLRLGDNPQAVVTTTPKPIKIIRELINDRSTHITKGSTYDNRSNLADKFFRWVVAKYEGSRLGRQELYAELLDDNPRALWKREQLDESRLVQAPEMRRVVVAVDPSGSVRGDVVGIVGAGMAYQMTPTKAGPVDLPHFYTLEDSSAQYSPDGWARAAVTMYYKLHADAIVAETNFGGDMVESVIRTVDQNVRVVKVSASRGKSARAEPVAALYEQGRGHHVGTFGHLEDELCQWDTTAGYSPGRLDALVWAGTELITREQMGDPSGAIQEIDTNIYKSQRRRGR